MSEYNIDIEPIFTSTVKVTIPNGRGVRTEQFDATYRALDMTEIEELDMVSLNGRKDFLRKAIISIDGVVGKGGPIAHSPELVERMIRRNWDHTALLAGYWEGVNRAAEGN